MSNGVRKVAILGSTGSIGCSTLEVAAASSGRIRPWLLAAHRSTERLVEQAQAVSPAWVVVTDEAASQNPELKQLPAGTRLAVGQDALCELVQAAEVDRVVSAIVGAAGLASTWSALQASKTVALANKETLVMAGPLVMQLAAQKGVEILPVSQWCTREMFPPDSWRFKSGVSRVIIGEPISTAGLTQDDVPDLVARTRAAILAGLPPEAAPGQPEGPAMKSCSM